MLKSLKGVVTGKAVAHSSEYLTSTNPHGTTKFKGSLASLSDLEALFSYRANVTAHIAANEVAKDLSEEQWNKLAVFFIEPMAMAYGERFAFVSYVKWVSGIDDEGSRGVLEKLGLLYAMLKIVEHGQILCEGGYM